MNKQIGFIQGRLSPLVDNKIQAFPVDDWQSEFPLANKIGLQLMEWTLDYKNLYENPLLTQEGQKTIKDLCSTYQIRIHSITGDNFMQRPFFKYKNTEAEQYFLDIKNIVEAAGILKIKYFVIPLVDNAKLENKQQETEVINRLISLSPILRQYKVSIIFESDFRPAELLFFIKQFPADIFGINYDIGNSAALDFDPVEEISTYGKYIRNVHIKDRILGGTTVPLGEGNADFPAVFKALRNIRYNGCYILQTARAQNGEHEKVLRNYARMVEEWI